MLFSDGSMHGQLFQVEGAIRSIVPAGTEPERHCTGRASSWALSVQGSACDELSSHHCSGRSFARFSLSMS